MITIQQIKAARALLNWTQEDLAKGAGVSKPAIANLERGTAQPRMETMNAIIRSMEEAGVEFTEGPGVRLRGEVLKVEVFEGKNAVFRFWDDQFETMKQNGGEQLVVGLDERIFDRLAGPKPFREMVERFYAHNITSRLLICEGDTYFVEEQEHYRWISKELFTQIPYTVYADKYSILLEGPPTRIVIIENKAIADSYRKQFNALWKMAKIPTMKG